MKRWFMIVGALALLGSLAVPAGAGLAQGNQARLRAVNASPDAPPLDVLVNGAVAFPALSFEGVTAYRSFNAGVTNVQFVPTGGGQPSLINTSRDLAANVDYTIVATGFQANIRPLLLIDDNTAPFSGQARLRLVHVSPNAGPVDVAITGGRLLFSDVPYTGVGGYITLPASTLNLEVRQAGTSNVLLSLSNVTLANCAVHTLFLMGLASGQPPLVGIMTTDATPGCAVCPIVAAAAATPSMTPTPTRTNTPTPTATTTATPTGTMSPTPTGTTSPTPTGTRTPRATRSPSPTRAVTATRTAVTATAQVTRVTATVAPTTAPTTAPTSAPTMAAPTTAPTAAPTAT